MIEPDHIYNMDCLEGMKQMADDSVDMVITSPPYNFCLRVRGTEWTHRTSGEVMHGKPMNKYTNGLSDSLEMDEYFEWQKEVITEMLRVCKGNVFYNIQVITGNKQAVFQLLGHFASHIKDLLIWDKQYAEPAMHFGCLNNEFELVIVFNKHDCKGRLFEEASFERGTMSNIIRLNKNNGDGSHRAAFPVQLPERLIMNFGKGVDTVLDPFIGGVRPLLQPSANIATSSVSSSTKSISIWRRAA